MNGELESSEIIEKELEQNGVYASNTLGTSMEPLFKTHRDMVIIKSPAAELKKYDVALYKDKYGRYVLHRVIRVKEEVYIIRGDNTFVNETVPKTAVLGVLTAYRNKNKRHTVEDASFKIYSRFWHFIYPLRLAKHKLRAILSRMYRKLFKRENKEK